MTRATAAARKALAARVRGRTPGWVWSLAVLHLGGAALMVAVSLAPSTGYVRTDAYRVLWPYAAAIGAGLLALGAGAPVWLGHVLVAQDVVAVSVLIALAPSPVGVVSTGYAYVPVVMHAAYWSGRAAIAVHGTSVVVGYGLAVRATGFPRMAVVWLTCSLVLVGIAVTLNLLVRSLRRAATCDALTGLLNRSGLRDAAAGLAPARPDPTGRRAVVVVDIDGFKQVNDREGHLAGDRLLVDLADAWRRQLRAGDVAARTGGDEFLFVLRGADEAAARAFADRLRAAHPAAWSYGVAEWRHGERLEAAVSRADAVLYRDKSRRRGTPGLPAAREGG